ncbi:MULTISPECIES: isoprenylcysteine carboxylmethyltransferase family protein [unclassified Mesorhizobium]|uniref:methyltransferase family protein n=1 Tax=unclassified Mesorhizobium TaxID=325217 RepID=UPI000FC9FF70|nr:MULTISPECIES: isoprenylcysteine carboxylmethyltransferase family protein [unclassified Mesorhizobium]RUV51655.1 isoprenylcysteine carboxylmethyltransferase family protein [Mesorhizobium sp. M7A.F.Ca.MR.228.00.0.0]RUT85885.1 isoprenylcysteine carboxylmethyltransferase family protein [Mesorhizobium sp. M7A.T.Ca.US.000.02.1.1]RUT86010.1 isoprenylcysteine carboxylmethyltransferase family protein [Mesorhizobium sp. M7A.T.Ca.US.000.02.2.1]RUU04736.1 isoprenylcysteine carboxylmethyltransferase fami
MTAAARSTSEMGRYQRRRRVLLALLIGAFCALLIFGGSPHDELTHERIEAHGIALILIGIGGRLWSILYIGGRKSAEVVTTGPYSVMRNPLYFFSTIAAVGIGTQTGSAIVAVASAVLCAAAFHIVTLREERHLTTVLGAPYKDYVARVPRFFPNPRLYRDQAEVTFTPRIFNHTLRDGLMFLVSIPFFELIESGQESGVIPVLFWLY